ncbi:hypothetical protein CsSME_00035738 [Camellia sinensis var. sinensis]
MARGGGECIMGEGNGVRTSEPLSPYAQSTLATPQIRLGKWKIQFEYEKRPNL